MSVRPLSPITPEREIAIARQVGQMQVATQRAAFVAQCKVTRGLMRYAELVKQSKRRCQS